MIRIAPLQILLHKQTKYEAVIHKSANMYDRNSKNNDFSSFLHRIGKRGLFKKEKAVNLNFQRVTLTRPIYGCKSLKMKHLYFNGRQHKKKISSLVLLYAFNLSTTVGSFWCGLLLCCWWQRIPLRWVQVFVLRLLRS